MLNTRIPTPNFIKSNFIRNKGMTRPIFGCALVAGAFAAALFFNAPQARAEFSFNENEFNDREFPDFIDQRPPEGELDPTGIAAVDGAVFALTGNILGAVNSRLAGMPNRFALPGNYARIQSLDNKHMLILPMAATGTDRYTSTSWWLKGFGAQRDLESYSAFVSSENLQGGSVLGVDGYVNGYLRFGVFGGSSYGALKADYNDQGIKTESYFGGIYARYGGVLSFTLTGGATNHNSKRVVTNAQFSGDAETAQADYSGYFLAPELTLQSRLKMPMGILWRL